MATSTPKAQEGGPGRRARVAVLGLFVVDALWFAAVRGVGWWGTESEPLRDALFMVLVSAPVVLGVAVVAGVLRRRGRGAILRWLLFTAETTWVLAVALLAALSYETRTSFTTPKESWLVTGACSAAVLLMGWWLEDSLAGSGESLRDVGRHDHASGGGRGVDETQT